MPGVLTSLYDQRTITSERDRVLLERKLQELLAVGRIKEVQPLRFAYAPHERWFQDLETGDIYFYAPPAEHVQPVWDRVDVGDLLRSTAQRGNEAGRADHISALGLGRRSLSEVALIRWILHQLVTAEDANLLKEREIANSERREEWFQDCSSGVLYRLVEDVRQGDGSLERVPHQEKPTVQ